MVLGLPARTPPPHSPMQSPVGATWKPGWQPRTQRKEPGLFSHLQAPHTGSPRSSHSSMSVPRARGGDRSDQVTTPTPSLWHYKVMPLNF